MKGWQYRYFVLDDNAGLFSYYTSREKMMRGARRGCVRLKGALIGIDDEVCNQLDRAESIRLKKIEMASGPSNPWSFSKLSLSFLVP